MTNKKIGLLLVNHGSRSETWRQALTDLEANVRPLILAGHVIEEVKTAFMEYTEPSIATCMKEFDEAGFSDVIIVPIFLTISSHSFEDIPTILGLKHDPEKIAELAEEEIERYAARANTHITPLLDFSNVLQKNVFKRCKSLSRRPQEEGLVLIGYGDAEYEKEWDELFNKVAGYVKHNLGIGEHRYGWCGHLVHYNPAETTQAIQAVLEKKDAAIVIPVLVAYDDMFQKNVIGRGVKNVEGHVERVLYNADSILPDADVERWVIDISGEYANRIAA